MLTRDRSDQTSLPSFISANEFTTHSPCIAVTKKKNTNQNQQQQFTGTFFLDAFTPQTFSICHLNASKNNNNNNNDLRKEKSNTSKKINNALKMQFWLIWRIVLSPQTVTIIIFFVGCFLVKNYLRPILFTSSGEFRSKRKLLYHMKY